MTNEDRDEKFKKFLREGRSIEKAIMGMLKKDFSEVESSTVLAALLHVSGALAEEVELPKSIWDNMTKSLGSDLPSIVEDSRTTVH